MTEEEKKMAAQAAEGTQPAPKEEVADNGGERKPADAKEPDTTQRKPHEVLYERIRTSRPDGKYDDDDEEYARQAMEIMDELEGKGKSYDELTQKLMSRFNTNPDEAGAFLDFLDGMSLPTAIRKNMGDEALTMKEGDEGWDEYVKTGEERKKQFEDMRVKMDEIKANAQASEEALKEFAKERNMSDEDVKALSDFVTEMLPDLLMGKISKEMYGRFMNARNYDADIDGAREQGRVDGRNERIDLEKKRMQGSGLPNANGGGNANEDMEETDRKNETAKWLGSKIRR